MQAKVKVLKNDFDYEERDCNVMRHVDGVGYQVRLDDTHEVITARDGLVRYDMGHENAGNDTEGKNFVARVLIFSFVVVPVFAFIVLQILRMM